MPAIKVLILVVLSAAALALAVALLRFNRKRVYVVRCAANATPEQLERIYSLVEQTGPVAANGFVLARTNRTSDDIGCVVPIPKELPDFPWRGRAIEIEVSKTVEFRFVESLATESSLLGQVYRPVRVPRHRLKNSNKDRNVFSPDRYLVNNNTLSTALEAVCPEYPKELLSYLLCVGGIGFEFEPLNQARIGTSPAWTQDPEYQTCDTCKKRMHLVLQMPGTVISKKAFREGTFYLFGCLAHPEQTKMICQFT